MINAIRYGLICFLLGIQGNVYAQSSNPVGTAYLLGNDCYVITSDINWQLGAVWFNDQLDLNDPFEINLSIYLGANDFGADGIVLVLQQVGTSALGESGGGLGFEGFSPSLGIELDTFQNSQFDDPGDDHMAVLKNGNVNHSSALNLAGPVPISPTSANVEDNQNHQFKLQWDPETEILEVFWDCELRLTYTGDIVNSIFNGDSEVFWGFTGSTGGLNNIQSVCISEFALGLQDIYQICEGESAQLGVSGGLDGTYSWSPAEFLDDATSQTPIATPDETTIYTVTYTEACGEETSLETVVEVANVTISLPENYSICEGEATTVEVDGNADVYTWPDGSTGSTYEAIAEGEILVTGAIGLCIATATTMVEFLPVPIISGIETNYEFCEGESTLLNAESDIGDSYLWSTGSEDAEIVVDESGEYEITVSSVDGCSSSFITEVEVTEYPVSTLPSELEACEGDVLTMEAGMADSYLWNGGSSNSTLNVGTAGIYSVEMANNGCLTYAETEVILNLNPIFPWTNSVDFCDGNSVWLEIPELNYDWYWEGSLAMDSVEISSEGNWELQAIDPITECNSAQITTAIVNSAPEIELAPNGVICDGKPFVAIASSDFEENAVWNDGTIGVELQIFEEGTYTLSTENECGMNSASIEVVEELCICPLFVPNAFSPDLDGVNEVFLPTLNCATNNYRFAIYNRWGQIVFESFEQGEGWNGASHGQSHWVEDDVYSWQVSYDVNLHEGVETLLKTGTVLVFR